MTNMPYIINLEFDFPDGDPTKKPTLLTPPTRVDDIGTDFTAIQWIPKANISDISGLKVIDIWLYSDAAKQNMVPLERVFGPPGLDNDGSLMMPILPTLTHPLSSYYYKLEFAENRFSMPMFDPTLKIQPRTSAGNSNQAGN